MSSIPSKVVILVNNYFTVPCFDHLLDSLPSIQSVDVISAESGKVRIWNRAEKEYYSIPLHKDNIKALHAPNYSTVIIQSDILDYGLHPVSLDIKSFVDFFLTRKKPIVALYKGSWIVVSTSSPELHSTASPSLKKLRATA